MIIKNNRLEKVEKKDVTKDGWVVVKNNIEKVGEHAFCDVKERVKTVVFESAWKKEGKLEGGCKIIEHHAFEGCENLKLVLLPNTLQEIGAGAFHQSGLVRIEIPASVRKIENMAFMRCGNLKTVIFDGNVDGWKKHLDKPYNGTLLFDYVFDYCHNLEKFVYKKNPYDMGLDLHKFDKAKIVIVDNKKAEEFWMKKLFENPLDFKHMDDERAKQKSFRASCKFVIEKSYKARLKTDDVSFYVNSAMGNENDMTKN